jgi:SanA protein
MFIKTKSKKTKKIITIVLLIIFIVFIFPSIFISTYQTLNPKNNNNPKPKSVIIFGTSIICFKAIKEIGDNCKPGDILKQRLDTAISLINSNEIDQVILTGDNKSSEYNEPLTMATYLISKGINPLILKRDSLGFSTIESCYRAKNVFNISKAYLVSNKLHMNRAMFLCENMGIDSYPIPNPDPDSIGDKIYNYYREFGANTKAFWEIWFYKP